MKKHRCLIRSPKGRALFRQKKILLVALITLFLVGCATAKIPVPSEEARKEAIRLEEEHRQYKEQQRQTIIEMGNQLLQHWPTKLPLKFEYRHSPIVNAYTDGKKVVVFDGLLGYLESYDELAMIIGHEIGHAVRKHLTKNELWSLGILLPSFVADALVEGYTGVDIGLRDIIGDEAILAFMRDKEGEADFFGALLAYQAGYDPTDFHKCFHRLAVRLGDTTLNKYGRAHPPNRVRKVMIEKEVDALRKGQLVPEIVYSLFLNTPIQPGKFDEKQLVSTCSTMGLKTRLFANESEELVKVNIPRRGDGAYAISDGAVNKCLGDKEIKKMLARLESSPLTAEDWCQKAKDELGSTKPNFHCIIAWSKKAIELNPDYAEAHSMLGLAYCEKKMWDKAIVEFNKALALNPDDAMAHNSLAQALHEKKDYELAMRHRDEAVKLEYPVGSDSIEPLKSHAKGKTLQSPTLIEEKIGEAEEEKITGEQLEKGVEGGRVHDNDWHLKYRTEGGKIYDRDWKPLSGVKNIEALKREYPLIWEAWFEDGKK